MHLPSKLGGLFYSSYFTHTCVKPITCLAAIVPRPLPTAITQLVKNPSVCCPPWYIERWSVTKLVQA